MHLPKVVEVGVTVLGQGTRLIAGEVGQRLAAQLHSLQASVPADVFQVRGATGAATARALRLGGMLLRPCVLVRPVRLCVRCARTHAAGLHARTRAGCHVFVHLRFKSNVSNLTSATRCCAARARAQAAMAGLDEKQRANLATYMAGQVPSHTTD